MILVYVLRYSNQSKSTKLNKLFLPSLIWWAKRTLIAIIQYQKFTQNIKFESILIINIKKKSNSNLKKKVFIAHQSNWQWQKLRHTKILDTSLWRALTSGKRRNSRTIQRFMMFFMHMTIHSPRFKLNSYYKYLNFIASFIKIETLIFAMIFRKYRLLHFPVHWHAGNNKSQHIHYTWEIMLKLVMPY